MKLYYYKIMTHKTNFRPSTTVNIIVKINSFRKHISSRNFV